MDKRQQKRWRREHGPRSGAKHEPWCFHEAEWGDVRVLVMPRTVGAGRAFDSNTGVVTSAPFHRALKAQIVVNDGRMPTCDGKALSNIIYGDKNKPWEWSRQMHAWTIPTYRVQASEINDAWREAIESLSKTMPQEIAEAQLEQTLGWCTDSLVCEMCHLEIPGHFPDHVIEQARKFGWGLNTGRPVCPAHLIHAPLWTDEEIAVFNHEMELKHAASARRFKNG